MKLSIRLFLAIICISAPLRSYAETTNIRLMIGIAFSGPTAGLTFTGGLSNEYFGRFIYSSKDAFALQLHSYANPEESKHYIAGAGMLNGTPYIRGAIGNSKVTGPWRFSGEIGLNLPLEKIETEDEGLVGVVNAGLYLLFLGAGVHYEF